MPHRYDDIDRERRRREEEWRRRDWMTYSRPHDYETDYTYEQDFPARESGSRFGGYGRGSGFFDRGLSRGPGSRDLGMYRGRSFGSRYDEDRLGYGRGGNRMHRGTGSVMGWDFDPEFDTDWDREFYDEEPYSYTYTEYWMIPGPFTGVGPEGYKRSDERIHEDVCERLTQHGQIDASNIHVEVQDGEVTLSGSVPDRRVKRMAEDTVETVPGVWDVHNQLRAERHETGHTVNIQGGRLHEDMKVIGQDGVEIGTVKRVRQNDFLVDRAFARDVFIPFHACQIEGDQVRLNILANDVDLQNWPSPDLIQSPLTGNQK